MLIKFTPKEHSSLDAPFQYLTYNLVETTLTFDEAREISKVLTEINPSENTWRISLGMQPPFEVADIPYDPETVGKHLANTIGRVSHRLSDEDYSEDTQAEIEGEVKVSFLNQKDDIDYITFAYKNKIWFQLSLEQERYELQYEITKRYIELSDESPEEKEKILADAILEMEFYEQPDWVEKWKAFLDEHVS